MNSNDVAASSAGRTPAGSVRANGLPIRFRVTTLALWALVFAAWTAMGTEPYLRSLLFVALGTSALLMTTAGAGGWRVAVLREMVGWDAAARAAWTTGTLGTVVFFECGLFGPSEGLAATATKLALSFIPSLCGGVLAAGLLALMLRARPGDQALPPRDTDSSSAWDLWLGRILFVVLIAWPFVQARLLAAGPRLADSVWLLHWPAVLVLIGTVAVIALLGGPSLRERAASAVLAGAGMLTSLLGLAQALLGMARADIEAVSAGLSFVATTCLATLLALALVTYPHDDRSVLEGHGAPLAARIAWVLFPLLTIGLMAITFIVILTPMARRL